MIPYVTTASHETTYKKLVIISSEINATVTPDRRLITSTLTWKKVPKVKSYDIFAGRVSGAEIVKNTEGGVMTSTQLKFDENCGVNGEQKFTQNFYVGSTAWNLGEGTLGYNGIGFTAELEEDSDVCNTDIGSIFSGATGYTAGLNFQTIKGSTVYISYQHATTNVSFSSVRRAYSFSNSG